MYSIRKPLACPCLETHNNHDLRIGQVFFLFVFGGVFLGGGGGLVLFYQHSMVETVVSGVMTQCYSKFRTHANDRQIKLTCQILAGS